MRESFQNFYHGERDLVSASSSNSQYQIKRLPHVARRGQRSDVIDEGQGNAIAVLITFHGNAERAGFLQLSQRLDGTIRIS